MDAVIPRRTFVRRLLSLESRLSLDRLFAALYRRLGNRYPQLVVLGIYLVAPVVVAGGVALLWLYVDMTTAQFLRVLVVSELAMGIEIAVVTVLSWRRLESAVRWLRGERDPETTAAAWRALGELPADYLRRWKLWSLLITCVPIPIFITLELSLPATGVLVLFLGSIVVLLYGLTLRFLLVELALRPVARDVSHALPDDFELGAGGLSVATKLLAGLPAINIITGVMVAGLSAGGTDGLGGLVIDIAFAVGVAFTLSLELTILLSKSILTPIGSLRRATDAIARGDLSARVPVLAGDETGRLAQSFNHMAAGLQERARLHEAFGTFVDPEIGRRVLAEGTLLPGEEVEVTVMFIDLRDFTAFAEEATAHATVEHLNRYFETVVPVLTRNGGHANKFLGDGVLGVFGAPEPHLDHADRALAAALEIVRDMERRFGSSLRAGIGVNSGEVVAGTIGGGGRLEFTVIGDVVNTAARVERATRETGDSLLVTGATLARLTRAFGGFEPRIGIDLRGKTDEVELFAPRVLRRPAGELTGSGLEFVHVAKRET